MKFLKTTALILATLASCASPALATTTPSNDGGFINAAVSDAVASYVAGTKGVVKGVAVWSASTGRFWDPIADGSGGGGSASFTAASGGSLAVTAGTNKPGVVDLFSHLGIVNYDSSGNAIDPSAPTNCGPTTSFVQCATKAGQPTLDANGAAAIPESVAPVVTKTTLVANTSTTICPTAVHPVSTEIYLAAAPASLGVGLKGQSLSTDAWGTGSTAADYVLSTVGVTYTSPVAYSTAITGRSTGTPSVTCVQTLRQ